MAEPTVSHGPWVMLRKGEAWRERVAGSLIYLCSEGFGQGMAKHPGLFMCSETAPLPRGLAWELVSPTSPILTHILLVTLRPSDC